MKSAGRNLSIRVKVGITILVSIVAITLVLYAISTTLILRSYERIEKRNVMRDTERVSDALWHEIDALDVKLVDWARWDDTYQYVVDQNAAYAESNLGISSIANLKINGMVFVDASGKMIFQEFVDFRKMEVISSDSLSTYFETHPRIAADTTTESPIVGLISLPEGPALIASEPILTSEGDGPARGALIFVKLLTSEEVDRLGKLTHLDVAAFPYADSAIPADVLFAKPYLSAGHPFTTPLSWDTIAGYSVVTDIDGAPLLILRDVQGRDIYLQGRQTFVEFSLILLLVGPFFGLSLLFVLQKLVFSRLEKTQRELGNIGKSDSMTTGVTVGARDELGDIETAINRMLSEIAAAQTDLEKFKLAVESADEHVIITDKDGKVLYANPSAEKITGYTRSEMMGNTPSLWGGQMPAPFYKKMWKTISKDKKTFVGEVNNKRKTGEEYLATVRVSPILNEKGDVQFFVGLEQDITKQRYDEHQRAQYAEDLKAAKENVELQVREKTKELSEERARFLASVNSLQLGFAIVDASGKLLVRNPALETILGAENEIRTLNDIAALFGNDLNLFSRLEECMEKHCVVEVAEITFEQKILRLSVTPVFVQDDGKEALGGVMLLEDITEAKKIEKAKTEFMSLASHQLRTPLSTINWYVELLLSGDAGKMTKKQTTYLGEIATGNKRMVSLVNSLLNVSRLELGKPTEVSQPTNFSAVAKETVAGEQGKIAEKKLVIHEAYEEVMDVPLDSKYGRMVVENIVSNALKYTAEGGSVNIQVRNVGKGEIFGGQKVTEASVGFSVTDTGLGIPEHQQKHVFEKLFRGDNVLDKDVDGTGLGLYIVKAILDQSGGKIWFTSKENVGTTFSVLMPVAAPAVAVEPKTAS